MNTNPNEKNVYDNSNKRTVFHLYEYEYVPERKQISIYQDIVYLIITFK